MNARQLAVEISISDALKAHALLSDNRSMFKHLKQEASNFYLVGSEEMEEKDIDDIKDWVSETLLSQNVDFWYTEY